MGSLAPGLSPDGAAARVLVGWCKRLERDAGRVLDGPRDAPRALDVDLLLLGSSDLDLGRLAEGEASPPDGSPWWSGEIRVPHPGLRQRRFVLRPLCDVVPELRLPRPGRVTVRRALADLGEPTDEQRVEVWRDRRSGGIADLAG